MVVGRNAKRSSREPKQKKGILRFSAGPVAAL